MKKINKNLIIIFFTIYLVLLSSFSCYLVMRGGYINKVLVRLNLKEETVETNWLLEAWENCIEQLDYDADIAFFGDSITYYGDWQAAFPEYDVINLGYPGDTLEGMIERIELLSASNPEKIFIMGGINGFANYGEEQSIEYYRQLIEEIEVTLPDSEIYLQSVLPITTEKEEAGRTNEDIVSFNVAIATLATEVGVEYLDLYSLYELDGSLNDAYTVDGIHLTTDSYTAWYNYLNGILHSQR